MAKGAVSRAAARKQKDKWKSKRWYSIRAPRNPWEFKVIGETLAEDDPIVIGRHYEIMQNELDGDFSKMHVKILFRVVDVVNNDALTEFIGYDLMKDHVRRLVRRERGKIDDTVDVVSKDGYYVRFKPLIISRSRIKASQKQQMRTIARNTILRVGAMSTWIDLQKSLFDGTLENTIKDEVNKIQPAKTILFRRVQLMQSGIILDEGPTLDEIYEIEKSKKVVETKESDVLVAAEAGAEISELAADDIPKVEEESTETEEESTETEEESTETEEESTETEEESTESSVDYSSMTVPQLKELLKEAGKPVSGKKADLITRLSE
jgi:small subunit ribosomal protein S3Ae|tara:strand:+ start:180 stop:1145 length:966 start_codon:yes stop_codon:yes gene_type:complete